MKYTYATLLLHETGAEINEQNLTNVLEAARADEITTSRIKALVAALEDVDISEYAAAATPAEIDDKESPEAEASSETEDRTGIVFGEDDASETDEEEESESTARDDADDNSDEDEPTGEQ